MKHTIYILFVMLLLASCASRKNLSNDIIYDANAEKYQQALQRSKHDFFASDSADSIYKDLGWAEQLRTKAKITNNTVPSVYKSIDNDHFTIEMPCWEFDTDAFWAANVIVEHKCLDSALVKAKIQGVDDIYSRSETNLSWHLEQKTLDVHIDSIAYVGDYADYMRRAKFACLCIMKEKKKYIVNATIQIPSPNYISNEEMILLFDEKRFREAFKEGMRKRVEEVMMKSQDIETIIQTEEAKTPVEQE